MRPIVPLVLLLPLAGCNSILDPAPYIPYNDPAVLGAISSTSNLPPGADANLSELTFAGLTDARDKMLAIGNGYLNEANVLAREQLGFDVPAIGLGVASIVSLSFHRAANATAALGLGSGTILGAKTYFEPGTKISAYSAAYSELFCAARAAGDLANAENTYSLADTEQGELTSHIQQAAGMLDASPDNLQSDAKAKLLAARDSAQTALTSLTAAINIETSATSQLQDFAMSTIAKTTDTIRNGAPSVADILNSIKSSAPAAATAATPNLVPQKPQPKPVPQAQLNNGAPAGQTAAETAAAQAASLTDQLNTDVTNAKSLTDGINAAWSGFSQCATLN